MKMTMSDLYQPIFSSRNMMVLGTIYYPYNFHWHNFNDLTIKYLDRLSVDTGCIYEVQ